MNPEELVTMAAALARVEDFKGAEAAAELAVALDPKMQLAWTALAATYARQNKHERAIACFEQAVHIDPKDIASFTSLGELLLELGAHTRAAAALESAMKLDPTAEHPSGRRARALVSKTLTHLKR